MNETVPEVQLPQANLATTTQPWHLRDNLLPVSIMAAALILASAWVYTSRVRTVDVVTDVSSASALAALQEQVTPPDGIDLPVVWGDLGAQLIANGTIDRDKFEALYAQRGGLDPVDEQLLTGADNGTLHITNENAPVLLNLLWALGLANRNVVLTAGPMVDASYGGAENFASTGGWTLARGSAMDHYARHSLVSLTSEQQALVERVSKNIYRPCCGNATYFPDCNHGMAMLGLLELMASQGVSEDDMYRAALAVNSYWFPDTYATIARYLAGKGIAWSDADPKGVLGESFSSASGYRQVLSQVQPVQGSAGGSCGV